MNIFLLFIALQLTTKIIDGVILTSPQNQAVVSGNQIKLECASNSRNGLQWQFTPVGSTVPVTIISGCVLNSAYATTFSVEIIDVGSCNIVVLNASVKEVGTYTCTSGFDPTQQAQLVVLDSKPNCTILFNGGNTADLVAGETTTMICTVRYSTNLSPPAAKWTDPQGQLVPGLPTGLPMDGNFYSYINITANKSNIQPYSIMIYFLPPDNTLSGVASNAPSYTYSWTSDVIQLLYPVAEISIASGECIEGFASFTCWASSNPPLSYQWMDCCRGVISIDSTIQLHYQGFYTCVASNVIRGTIFQRLENITFSGCPQPSTISSASPIATTTLLTKVNEDNGGSSSPPSGNNIDNSNNKYIIIYIINIIILSVFLGISIILNICNWCRFCCRSL